MKFVVLGTSQFTVTCTQVLLDSGVEVQALVSLPPGARQLDSIDLEAFAKENGIAYHEFADLEDPEALRTLQAYHPDYIFSSWPHLLKPGTLRIPRGFVIGSHPAALPFNRGRHPLYWLFCLGFDETKISFFVVDEKVDNGGIVAQIPFVIPQQSDVSEAFRNMSEAAKTGMAEVVANLRNPDFRPAEQDASKANYWRKRSVHDVIIDPRLCREIIIRTVRSFAPPYPGAILVWKEHSLRIAAAEADDCGRSADEIQRMEHGLICARSSTSLHIKCGDGIVKLDMTAPIPDAMAKARYIQPPTYYLAAEFSP